MSHELPDPSDLTGQSKSPKMKFRDDIEIDSLENSRPSSPDSNRKEFKKNINILIEHIIFSPIPPFIYVS